MVGLIIMLGRTHDLGAFTAILLATIFLPIPQLSLATILVAILAGMIGGLLPDMDEPSSDFWDTIPVGEIFSKIFKPFTGKHRHLSHSIVGIFMVIFFSRVFINLIKPYLLVDLEIVWYAFLLGYCSHLIMDSLTREGLPLFWPLKIKIGIPPLSFLRMKTGGLIEKGIVFPGLFILDIYLITQNYKILAGLIGK